MTHPDESQRLTKHGRWKHYFDGERYYMPCSNLLKYNDTTAETYHLDRWKERIVLAGAAARPDIVMAAAAIGVAPWSDDGKKELNALAKAAGAVGKGTDGARTGTAMHTATERLDRGTPLSEIRLPYPYDADLRAYEALRRLNGYRNILVERTVRTIVPPGNEATEAGTFDRIDDIPGYGPMLTDVKTEGDPLLNLLKIAAQLAFYARGEAMWRVDKTLPLGGEWIEMPKVRTDLGLIYHVRNGRAVPIMVNLDEGWDAVLAAKRHKLRVNAAKAKMGEPGSWAFPFPHVLPPAADLAAAAAAPEIQRAYGVGDSVVVGGLQFVKHAEIPDPFALMPPATPECLNCDPLVSGASTTRVDGSESGSVCRDCGLVTMIPAGRLSAAVPPATQVATRRPDGLVEWVPEAPTPGVTGGEFLRLVHGLLENIAKAETRERLAELFELAGKHGVPWGGDVERAGVARLRVIECPQRALHTGGGACACGWTAGQG